MSLQSRDYNNWKDNSGNRNYLKNYNNQEFPPVGVEHMTEKELKEYILLKSPCPPLHLLLCITYLVKVLEKIWPFGLKLWMRQVFLCFKNYFNKTLVGNQCSKLVSNYAILENLAVQHNRPDIMPFVRVFKALNSVKTACFGLKLDPNFVAIIDEFKDSLVSLGEMHDINITPKFHMICVHVKQNCQMTKP